ncbi:threonine--tRNA ligase [Candidatus Woesearchaeota archaeon]|nr:threonine--tRNA ligase [Candidatus Woesearchaeota archaeon]
MPQVSITFQDGSQKKYDAGITLGEIAKDQEGRFGKTILAASVDDHLQDLSRTVEKDSSVVFLTFDTHEGRDVFRHSTSHILAQAVLRIWPDAKPTIGPAIEDGFYYDFDMPPVGPEDLKRIEKEMSRVVQEKIPIERKEVSKADALREFKGNEYKIRMIKELDEGTITIYKQGDFSDLCRGPHVPHTGYIRFFALTKVAGAYWRGDAKNKMLQRIYGISFPEKAQLDEYKRLQQEARQRDHRKIGRELDLFSFQEEGPGFPFWHPGGMVLRNQIEAFYRRLHHDHGYVEIKTPIILSRTLWEKSGHWDHYRENMYFTTIDGADYAVKPMNCPGGVLVFKSRIRSYKELPMKVAEFGLVHRHELAGVLHGLFRVRVFTQDDAHVYCLPEQLKDEIIKVIDLVFELYHAFGFEDFDIELSTRPEKSIGSDAMWENAEGALRDALEEKRIPYKLNPGDGAFYGPKIDFHIKDCMRRSWQCGTIQVDFAMPETLDITYMGEDGTQNHRPVMIHRAIMGSIERFIGILLEHTAGKLPMWLSPVQVKILTVSEKFTDYANGVAAKMDAAGLRVRVDDRNESIAKKVREAQLQKVNYILVVGEKEQKGGTVAVRTRANEVRGEQEVADFIRDACKEADSRG